MISIFVHFFALLSKLAGTDYKPRVSLLLEKEDRERVFNVKLFGISAVSRK